MYRLVYVLAYCIVYLVRLLYVITCKLCSEYLYRVYVMLCYIMFAMLWYGRFGRRLVIRISVPSLNLCHFVHLTNKRLVTCNLYISGGKSHTLGCNPVARGPNIDALEPHPQSEG